ncbi:hypothetical protein EAI_16647, partial [Harpegnathos saltator]
SPRSQQTAYVWSSVCLGALSMLAKETGVTVLALNLLYDLCRSWHSIKRSIFEAKWNDDSRYFSRRAAALLVSLKVGDSKKGCLIITILGPEMDLLGMP